MRLKDIILTFVTFALMPAFAAAKRAEVRLPALVGDNMVVQQGVPRVWGWAAPASQ